MTPRSLLAFLALALAAPLASAADNQLTAAEKKAGWQLLFDGRTMNGWRTFAKKTPGGWEVLPDGTLHAIAKVKGAEIITERKFKDFELSWDWKVAPKGNNGVKYFVSETTPGPEYQMIDDHGHPDGLRGGLHQTAAFYDVLPPAADKPLKTPGEWNSSRILARGNHVEHWLNGKKVLEFELDSAEVKAGLAKSKFRKTAGYGEHIEGHIMLTYHQDDCWFKNIKLRELK